MANSRAFLLTHVLLAALVCSLHHWAAVAINRSDYTPFAVAPAVSALTFDETHAYAPPARRLSSGRLAAETDNYEHGNWAAGIPFLPEALLAGTAWLAGGSLERAFVIVDALFPALLFALYFAMAGTAVRNVYWRLLVAWASLLIPFNLLNTFWLGDDALSAPLEITRTPQPEISYPFLLLAAVAFARLVSRPARTTSVVLAGLSSAAVVYCYYFYTIAWALGLAILLAIIWIVRRECIPKVVVAIGLAGLLSVPFALQVLRGRAQGGQSELLARMGEHTHRPAWLALSVALLLTPVLFRSARRLLSENPVYTALTALFLGALFGMNIQIISGYETQPWHFWKRLGLPLCFFLLASGVSAIAERKWGDLSVLRVAAQVGVAALVINAVARQIVAAQHFAPWQRASGPENSLLVRARSEVPAGSVIGSVEPELILLIPALTTDYTYVPSGLRSLTSSKEITERFDALARLLGLPAERVAELARTPNHLGHSTELLQTLGLSNTGDQTVYSAFVKQYAHTASSCPYPRARLDFVITRRGSAELAELQRCIPKAKILFGNDRYELIDVREQR